MSNELYLDYFPIVVRKLQRPRNGCASCGVAGNPMMLMRIILARKN